GGGGDVAQLGRDGGDVDDAAPAPLQHDGDHVLAAVEGSLQVDGDDRIPILFGHRLQGAPPDDAGVVHQDIDPSVPLPNLLDRLGHLVIVGDIHLDAHRIPAGIDGG